MQQGDIVYLEDGQICEYVAATHDGHVVRPMFESEGREPREPWYGEPRIVRLAFAQEPKPRLSAELAAMTETADALRKAIHDLKVEKMEAENRMAEQRRKIASYPTLDRLEQFLEGRITHVVKLDTYHGPQVLTFEEGASDASNGGYMALLTLRGGAKDIPSWKFSHRLDDGVLPALSLEEATQIAKNLILMQWDRWREAIKRRSNAQTWHERALKLGMTIPPDIAEHVRMASVTHLRSYVERHQKELNTYKTQLRALGEEIE